MLARDLIYTDTQNFVFNPYTLYKLVHKAEWLQTYLIIYEGLQALF
jgi:hypothetical protein